MDKITSTSEFAFSTTRWEGDALRNKGESYGYGRVSTKQQNLDRQLVQFAILPIKKSNIFVDRKMAAHLTGLITKNWLRSLSREIHYTYTASTGLAGIMMRYWSSGLF